MRLSKVLVAAFSTISHDSQRLIPIYWIDKMPSEDNILNTITMVKNEHRVSYYQIECRIFRKSINLFAKKNDFSQNNSGCVTDPIALDHFQMEFN